MEPIKVINSTKQPTFSDLRTHGTTIASSWSGEKIHHPVRYLFWVDNLHLHFLASDENSPGLSHPKSEASKYQAELWKYDVAEFFLTAADRSHYLEFNLAPNGAWWTSDFTAPRQASPGEPSPVPAVLTSSQQGENSWQALASIPLPWLRAHYGFGKETTLNATFILKSPKQIFLSAADLGPGDPDFHRPEYFPHIRAISLA